jgi:hypothetical protein
MIEFKNIYNNKYFTKLKNAYSNKEFVLDDNIHLNIITNIQLDKQNSLIEYSKYSKHSNNTIYMDSMNLNIKQTYQNIKLDYKLPKITNIINNPINTNISYTNNVKTILSNMAINLYIY